MGTVQFGMAYGISNCEGQPSAQRVQELLQYAAENGVALLDTSPAYGTSEAILGENSAGSHFQLLTKTAKVASEIPRQFERSLQALRVPKVYGLLIHDIQHLLEPTHRSHLITWLGEQKIAATVDKIGVSAYRVEEIEQLLEFFTPDIIQLPFNVLDQNLLRSGLLSTLKEAKVEIHVRSAFLQGLLLMDVEAIPKAIQAIASPWVNRFHEACHQHGVERIEGALNFLKQTKEIDAVILGCNSLTEFKGILKAWNAQPIIDWDYLPLNCDNPQVTNPSLWSTHA